MKFSSLSMAFIAAAAAPGASNASSSSLRGYDHDNGSGSGTPIRLLKPDPDLLPAQANTDMPELPSAAQDNANANGEGNGRPFDGVCLWPLNTPLCREADANQFIKFDVCPTEEAQGKEVGEFAIRTIPLINGVIEMSPNGFVGPNEFTGYFTNINLTWRVQLLASGEES